MSLPLTELQQHVLDCVAAQPATTFEVVRDAVIARAPWATGTAVRNALESLLRRDALAASKTSGGLRVYCLGHCTPAMALVRAPEGQPIKQQFLHVLRAAGRDVAPLEMQALYPERSQTRVYATLSQLYCEGLLHRRGAGTYVYRAAAEDDIEALRAARAEEARLRARRTADTRTAAPAAPAALAPPPLWDAGQGAPLGPPALGTRCVPYIARAAA